MSNITNISTDDVFAQFLEQHQNEIVGLYRDKYFKNGGWNGMMDALAEVEKRYGVCFEVEAIGNHDKLVNEYLF
jgi:hypothetical protein